MSRREDILRCIDITIMDRSAHTALPSSYFKTFPTLWAGAAVTHARGVGGKLFVEFLESPVHAYSITNEDADDMRENAANAQIMWAPAPLSHSGVGAGVSAEEL